MFNFEKLDVWQEVIQFADPVYQLTRAFPTEERFGLTNQMRRAADQDLDQGEGSPLRRVKTCRNKAESFHNSSAAHCT